VNANVVRLMTSPVGIVLGLLALHALAIAAVFDPTIFTGGDNGVYVALSRSLLEQHAYLSIHDPVPTPHTFYPPGYPVILAIGAVLGIQPWVPIKLITVAFSLAGLVLSYLYVRRRATDGVALFAALCLATAPGLLALAHTELSDVPFWALVMLALWALEAMPRESRRRAVVGGIALAAAYLTRTAALPIIVATFGWLLLEKRFRQAGLVAAFVLPAMAAWYWWNSTQTTATNVYANQFWYLDVYQPELGRATAVDILARIPANLRAYAGVMVPLLFRGERGPLVLGSLFIGLAIVGWATRVRKPGLGEILFPLYCGMLLLVPPAWAGERYMLPLLPLALGFVADVVLYPVRRWRPQWSFTLGAVAATVVVLLGLGANVRRAEAARACRRVHSAQQPYACLPPAWQEYLAMADWSRTGLPADAVVVSRKPGLFFALSDRRGLDIPKTQRPEEFFRLVEAAGARYIVLDQTDFLTPSFAAPTVVSHIGSFCLVHASASQATLLLGIRLEGPHAPTATDAAPAVTTCEADYFAAP
jgi:4-amino-4-deoxy-L-arabinose transferase-like glycosyltransferase